MFSGDHRSHRRRRLRALLLVATASLTTWISGTAVRADTIVVPDPDGPRGGHAIQDLRVANDGPLVTATVRHRSTDWRGTVRIELDPTPGVADAKYVSVVGHRTGRGPSFTRADGSSWVCESGTLTSPRGADLTTLTVSRACLAGADRIQVRATVVDAAGLRRDVASSPVVPQQEVASTATAAKTTAPHPPCPTLVVRRDGDQSGALYKSNTTGTWDLRGAVWRGLSYPVRSESWTQGCIEGGVVHGPIPRAATRDTWYDGIGGTAATGEGLRITMTKTAQSWVAATDMFVEDMEDAYDPNAADATARTYLDHVRAQHIRDDCIENEDPVHHMYVTNSFFDGCFTAFAERPPGSTSAQNGTTPADFVVENSLVHVTPQPLGPKYCASQDVTRGRCRPDGTAWLGSYGIWKWSDHAAANVEVRNTIFRLDMPSYSSCRAQQWPRGTYENVTLVWTGTGPYETAGGCTNTLPPGVELTRDESLWRQAVDAWQNQ